MVWSIVRIDSGYPIQINQATLGGKEVKEPARPAPAYSDSVTLSPAGTEAVRTLSDYNAMEKANALLSDQIGLVQSRFAKLFAHATP